jgi:four helix bundle protein
MPHKGANGYERLEVYQRAMALVGEVESLVRMLPSSERYALASQMRRASRSIPANIAEGYAKRKSAKEFRNYLTTAMGSASEMKVHLAIAVKLGYGSEEDRLFEEYDIVGRQLNKLISSWKAGPPEVLNQQRTTNN